MSYDIYYNSRTKVFSVRQDGRVVARATHIHAYGGCQFVVQPAGRARALRTGAKTVHAFVRCFAYRILTDAADRRRYASRKVREIYYSPFQHESFVYLEGTAPVATTHSTSVLLAKGRVFTLAPTRYRRYIPRDPPVTADPPERFVLWPGTFTVAGISVPYVLPDPSIPDAE